MKVMFIDGFGTPHHSYHLGLGYVAAVLRERMPDAEVSIVNGSGDVETAVETEKPDVVGISAASCIYGRMERIAKVCQQHGTRVVVGGIHITALPGTLTGDMEAGVIGEGEMTMVDLVENLRNGNGSFTNVQDIPGIVYHKDGNGSIAFSETRSPIQDMDSLPFPARDLMIKKYPVCIPVISSRGCPYDCTFCASTRVWSRKVRFFSPEYVVSEIEAVIKEYGPKEIVFYDDLFIASKKRLGEIAALIEKRGINKKVRFHVSGRANLINPDVVEQLKRMGVFNVFMGLESGTDKVLTYLKGGNVTVENNRAAVRMLHEAGIYVSASFVIGAPEETREDILETLAFIRDNPLARVDTYILTPFPGSGLWDYARDRGLVSDDMNWNQLEGKFAKDRSVIVSETLSRAELYRLFRRFKWEHWKRRVTTRLHRMAHQT